MPPVEHIAVRRARRQEPTRRCSTIWGYLGIGLGFANVFPVAANLDGHLSCQCLVPVPRFIRFSIVIVLVDQHRIPIDTLFCRATAGDALATLYVRGWATGAIRINAYPVPVSRPASVCSMVSLRLKMDMW